MAGKKIEGLIAATFTPFYEDGSLNTQMIPPLVDKLAKDGLKGIFVCGSNGEGPNMTLEERKLVAETFVKAAGGRLKIIVHVGHSSIADARSLATHAAAIGADAFSSVAAFYFKPASVQILADCMSDIASAAPELPFLGSQAAGEVIRPVAHFPGGSDDLFPRGLIDGRIILQRPADGGGGDIENAGNVVNVDVLMVRCRHITA